MQELSGAHLYFNGIFYLSFRKELLILVEANFSHLFFTRFLLRFVKQCASQKYLPSPKGIGLSLMQKLIFLEFSIKTRTF